MVVLEIIKKFTCCSESVRSHGFTILIDMRGSAWAAIKPILKVLQEHFPSSVHQALVVKPDNFWQKQRTTIGAHKYKFEVSILLLLCNHLRLSWLL